MLTPATHVRIAALFEPPSREEVARLLDQKCGNNLPFCEKLTPEELERIRFAALKVSAGDYQKLKRAVEVAQQDWRDLLVAAGFENDLQAHKKWMVNT